MLIFWPIVRDCVTTQNVQRFASLIVLFLFFDLYLNAGISLIWSGEVAFDSLYPLPSIVREYVSVSQAVQDRFTSGGHNPVYIPPGVFLHERQPNPGRPLHRLQSCFSGQGPYLMPIGFFLGGVGRPMLL